MRKLAILSSVASGFIFAAPVGAAPPIPQTAVLESTSSVTALAACFQRTADFASFAHFARDDVRGTATYRLRFDAVMLEEVRFIPRAGSGSRIEIALSHHYSRRDRAAFQVVRGDALARCAAAGPQFAARAENGVRQ